MDKIATEIAAGIADSAVGTLQTMAADDLLQRMLNRISAADETPEKSRITAALLQKLVSISPPSAATIIHSFRTNTVAELIQNMPAEMAAHMAAASHETALEILDMFEAMHEADTRETAARIRRNTRGAFLAELAVSQFLDGLVAEDNTTINPHVAAAVAATFTGFQREILVSNVFDKIMMSDEMDRADAAEVDADEELQVPGVD